MLSYAAKGKKNPFGSPLPSYAEDKYFPEYSWAFRKQACKEGKAGLESLWWECDGRRSEDRTLERTLGELEGEGLGTDGGVCEANRAKLFRMTNNWRREESSLEALPQPVHWLSFNVLQETQGMIRFLKLLLVGGLFL